MEVVEAYKAALVEECGDYFLTLTSSVFKDFIDNIYLSPEEATEIDHTGKIKAIILKDAETTYMQYIEDYVATLMKKEDGTHCLSLVSKDFDEAPLEVVELRPGQVKRINNVEGN